MKTSLHYFICLITMLLAINLQANNERFNFDGGQIYLSGGATEIEVCSGDGIADELDITRVNWEGMWTYWVITNPEGIILSIVDELPLDFEGAGAGVCLVWHLAVKDFTSDFEVGMHKDEVTGWLDYSNEITVTRTAVAAASIDVNGATELETCVGDGISDAFTVSYDGGAGTYSKWIITDEDLNILALQTSATFDLEGAGPGTCLIWRMTYNSIAGNVVGLNAGNLIGCFALSNPITVVRGTPESAEIALENGEISLDICAGDGISDSFTPVLTGGAGENNAWIITDPDLNIIGLPEGPSFDLEGAGEGVCLLWNIKYSGTLLGRELGANAGDLSGCYALSNAITVNRSGVLASSITLEGGGTDLSICAGDGVVDPFTPIVEGGEGESSAWVITDTELNILGLPDGPTFDLEGAGAGTCLLWHVSFNGELTGVEVGLNAADLGGCLALSNAITVTREGIEGATIAIEDGGTELEICVGDGVADPFTVTTEGGIGENNAWVITDPDLNILGLPEGPVFDLEGAGTCTCLVWFISFNGDLSGAEVGANAGDLGGCFALSNAITVNRKGIRAAEISLSDGATELTICAGDGVADPFTPHVEGGEGENTSWVITDPDLNILGLPEGPTFDLEGAGEGTCLIWHVYSNGELTGAEVGGNAADLKGCLALSNPITVTRNGVGAASIALQDGSTELEICAGDGIADPFTVTIDGGIGESTAWVITDPDLNILGLPDGPTFDLEGAGTGTCLVWYVSFNGTLSGAEVGANAADLSGCFILSNAITVERKGVEGAAISLESGATELTICAGDGMSDAFTPIIEGGMGDKSAWVITDPELNILGLPEGPTFDLEEAGEGTCLVWLVSFNGEILGAEVGGNASNLSGCLALSNPITVTRNGVVPAIISLESGGTELEICVGDGIADPFTVITEGGLGESSSWIITDPDLNILGLPDGPTFDLEGAGIGTCLVWYALYNGTLSGVEVGANAANIGGCFILSNAITVQRKGVVGAALSLEGGGSEITICAGDGVSDAFTPIVDGGEGDNESWVITDTALNILGLPEGPTFDLEGAGEGTCLVWHIYSNGEITGAEVGMNAADLSGCLALSNPITVTRNGVAGGSIALLGGGTEMFTCAGDGIADEITAFPDGMAVGENSAWVITDTLLNILGLPEGPTFDLEGAGQGVCLIWMLSFNGEITGTEVGANAADLEGCFALSNAIKVVRQSVTPSVLSLETGGDTLTICVGDGISDAFTPLSEGGMGEKSAWVITDPEGTIIGLPLAPPFDLEGAGEGTCLIWELTFNGSIFNIDLGLNANDIDGCASLSNPITVVRNEVSGGILELEGGGSDITICAGDGVSDSFNVVIDSFIGENTAWIITDQDLNILGLPTAPPFDLEGAGEGICLIWHAAFNDSLDAVEIGLNAGNINGCLALSNPITVTRVTTGSLCGGLLLSEHVDIFPNPSNQFIKVSSEMRLSPECSISIYDTMGKQVKSKTNLYQEDMKINIQDLESGMYFLSILDEGQNIIKQFVKVK